MQKKNSFSFFFAISSLISVILRNSQLTILQVKKTLMSTISSKKTIVNKILLLFFVNELFKVGEK